MALFVQSNIFITDNAKYQMQKHSLSEDDIYYVINNYDYQDALESSNYKRVKKFSGYSVGLYCKWKESQSRWIVTSCWRYS